MRAAWITGKEALRQRMIRPQQVDFTAPEAEMPGYMETFLSSLRLLIGVPFENMVPDPRLLPPESIRFFYLDRSWADRLVDGAIAVGKIGTREQAHHHAHAAPVSQQLDLSERMVRDLQRDRGTFAALKSVNDANKKPADVVTGFLLRSFAVAGWPHMDVRAYSDDLQEPLNPADPAVAAKQLQTLRLELLSPSVMLALFQGIPKLVFLEEPHHSIQFGVNTNSVGQLEIDIRSADGHQIRVGGPASDPIPIPVPVRVANPRVIHVSALRRALHFQKHNPGNHAEMPEQNGSASFAIEVLQPPWRQRFEGTVDHAEKPGSSGRFATVVLIGKRVTEATTKTALTNLIKGS
jgi:hypothetical protein